MHQIRVVHSDDLKSTYENFLLRKFYVGDSFGELALVDADVRRVSVTAASDGKLELITLHKSDYARIFAGSYTALQKQKIEFFESLEFFPNFTELQMHRLAIAFRPRRCRRGI